MITVTFCLYIKQSGGIRTENKVYTQSELKAQNIITTDYVPNLEPGEFIAVLDMKAEARNCLRVFFTFRELTCRLAGFFKTVFSFSMAYPAQASTSV